MDDEKITINVKDIKAEFKDNPNTKGVDNESKEKTQSEKSDDTYQKIVSRVVDITHHELSEHKNDKRELRTPLLKFVIVILSIQIFLLGGVLFFNRWLLLDTEVIKAFIVSVVAETLGGIMIMIRFAFSSKQELELIQILNSVVSKFKVFAQKDARKESNSKDKD